VDLKQDRLSEKKGRKSLSSETIDPTKKGSWKPNLQGQIDLHPEGTKSHSTERKKCVSPRDTFSVEESSLLLSTQAEGAALLEVGHTTWQMLDILRAETRTGVLGIKSDGG